jgi:predicted nucleic acid-binding protein
MIFIDTNVFVLSLRYPRDANAAENRRFLDLIHERDDGVTSVINVLETCGVLSFNLSPRQLRALFAYFDRQFAVRIVGGTSEGPLVAASGREVLGYLGRRLSFGDGLVAYALETWAPRASAFVSWDARHFLGKVSAPALTPSEFLNLPNG